MIPVAALASGPSATLPAHPAPAPPPSTTRVAATAQTPHDDPTPLELGIVWKVWPDLLLKPPPRLWWVSQVEPIAVVGPDILVIAAKPGYNAVDAACESPETLENLARVLQRLICRPVTVRYERSPTPEGVAPDARSPESRRQDALTADPMIQKVVELFEARSVQMDYDGPDSRSTP